MNKDLNKLSLGKNCSRIVILDHFHLILEVWAFMHAVYTNGSKKVLRLNFNLCLNTQEDIK